jgi:hypothetical protein
METNYFKYPASINAMKITIRDFFLVTLFFAVAACAQAQLCGRWTVTVDVEDNKGVPVDRSSVSFIDLADDDVAKDRPFKKDEETAGRFFVTFIEGDKLQSEYNVLVKAIGYQNRTAPISIDYCHNTSIVIGLNPNKPKS